MKEYLIYEERLTDRLLINTTFNKKLHEKIYQMELDRKHNVSSKIIDIEKYKVICSGSEIATNLSYENAQKIMKEYLKYTDRVYIDEVSYD